MTEHTDNGLNLGNFVVDDNNQERQSWKCFGQTCNRSLVFFLSQFFVILLILACCIVRITLAETCEETTVWIAILSSTVGYILPSPKLWTKSFLLRNAFLFHWWDQAGLENLILSMIGYLLELFNPILIKFTIFINIINHFTV